MSRPAVLLDRDGTINVRPPPQEYVRRAGDFRWLPGADRAIARLASAGWPLFVVSNQRGVARGLVEPAVLGEIEAIVQCDLARLGCRIEAFEYCVHGLDDACACRKPEPGMLLSLAARHGLDLGRSWMIGDAPSDVRAGAAAGCRTCLLGDGPPAGETARAADLAEAADRILGKAATPPAGDRSAPAPAEAAAP